MSFTTAQLSNLEDVELLRVAYAEQDALTSTPLELELALRLNCKVTELVAVEPVADLVDEYGIEPAHLRDLLERLPGGEIKEAIKVLSTLAEEDITTAAEVKAALVIADKLRALTEDPAKALEALETLFNTATA